MTLKKTLIYPMLGLLAWPGLALAELKIGFVDVAQVMRDAPQSQKAEKEMEREFSPRKNRLDASRSDVQRMEDKLNRDGAVMSESERSKLQNELVRKARDLKRTENELLEDFNIRRSEILTNLQKVIAEAINDLAKEEGYDLVLTGSGVGYVSEAIDVTAKLQQKLKDKF
ncbi:MAG: OmpH family outer membrane protein [Gammaproteobacteria bacterium]